MVNLTNVERVRRMDIAGSRLEPQQVLRIGGALLRNLFSRKERRYAPGNRDIGRKGKTGFLTAGADLGNDGGEWGRLELQPVLAQCRADDFLDLLRQPLAPTDGGARQQGCYRPLRAIAGEEIVDFAMTFRDLRSALRTLSSK